MPSDERSTREQILDTAQSLIQEHGYLAVSFRDLADRVGIKTASIHYHFPVKGDLGRALVQRYRLGFTALRTRIDAEHRAALDRFAAFSAALVGEFRKGHRMCLCGILAAESSSLPEDVKAEVLGFFADNENWLIGLLKVGVSEGSLRVPGDIQEAGRAVFSSIEGAITTAWTFRDADRLGKSLDWLLVSLKA